MSLKYLNLLSSLVVLVLGFFCIEIGNMLIPIKLPADFEIPFSAIDDTLNITVDTFSALINQTGVLLKKSGVTLAGVGGIYSLVFCCVVIYRKGK